MIILDEQPLGRNIQQHIPDGILARFVSSLTCAPIESLKMMRIAADENFNNDIAARCDKWYTKSSK